MKTQKTVLIIEDEKSLRDAVVDMLSIKGFSPLAARNGKEGVDLALSKHPDLILLDLIMPEMDGMEALQEIREDAWGLNVPIIILTNLGPINGSGAGFMATHALTHYFIKSDWKIHDIAEKISQLLDP
ncbi:MAG: response regulator [bacterium]|nr:response regulator [bacterium]